MMTIKTSVIHQKYFKSKYRQSNWMRLTGIWPYNAVSQMWTWLWAWRHLFYCWKKAPNCFKFEVLWFLLNPRPPPKPSSMLQHLYLSLTQNTVLSSKSPKLPKVQRWQHTTCTVCLLFICLKERPDTDSWWMCKVVHNQITL